MHLWCHCFWRFFGPGPQLGKHIITEFIHDLFVSIKAAMDLLSIPILLQLWCVYFCCPENRAQARAEFMGLVWAERERQIIYLLANRIFMASSLFDRSLLIVRGTGSWRGGNGHYVHPPPRFNANHVNSQAMCLQFFFYYSMQEAAFDSHLLPLLHPLFLSVYLVLCVFLGPHLYWANIL